MLSVSCVLFKNLYLPLRLRMPCTFFLKVYYFTFHIQICNPSCTDFKVCISILPTRICEWPRSCTHQSTLSMLYCYLSDLTSRITCVPLVCLLPSASGTSGRLHWTWEYLFKTLFFCKIKTHDFSLLSPRDGWKPCPTFSALRGLPSL